METKGAGGMKLTFHKVSARLDDMDLEIDLTLSQNATGLFGPSGSGKTSLLELVAGLRRPDQGAITMDGVVLTDAANRVFVPARQRAIGYVPQDLALFPHMTVRQNIAYGSKENGGNSQGPSHTKLCETLEITELLDRTPAFLSGGEKQRVAFARALLASPKLLLLDEPLASLDESLKERILPFIKRIRDEFAIPMIYVSHAASEIMALCGDVLILDGGKCVGQGKPEDLFETQPATNYRLKSR